MRGQTEIRSIKTLPADLFRVELLPRSTYSARDSGKDWVLDISLEDQYGVHAVNSDRRVDFHARFDEPSFKP